MSKKLFFKPETEEFEVDGHKISVRGLSRIEYTEIRKDFLKYRIQPTGKTVKIEILDVDIPKMYILMIKKCVKIDGRPITDEEIQMLDGDIMDDLVYRITQLSDISEEMKKKFGVLSTDFPVNQK